MGEEKEDDDQGVPTRAGAGVCTAAVRLGDRSRGRSTRATRAQMGLKILDRTERRRENRSISLPSLARPTDRATARLHLSSLDGCINIPCVFAPVRERESGAGAINDEGAVAVGLSVGRVLADLYIRILSATTERELAAALRC